MPLMATDLEKSIFQTIAMFSLFEYPPTAFEIWKWLFGTRIAYRYEDVIRLLEQSDWLRGKTEEKNGFYFLLGQEKIIETRHARFFDAVKKFKRVRHAAHYLARVPIIRSAYVCNTLAWMNTKPESDIDLFLVTKKAQVWLGRLLTVFPFAMFGMRPKLGVKDPLCFSFFASEEALNLRALKIEDQDWYLALWIRSLVPLFEGERGKATEENGWVGRFFPNSFSTRSAKIRRLSVLTFPFYFPKFLNFFARVIQVIWLPKHITEIANNDSRVVLTEQMLKFHPNDRRQFFIDELRKICLNV